MTNILFIGGSGRSGTNITKEIFSLHQDVATLPFETRFSVDPKGIYCTYNNLLNSWSPFTCDHDIKKLEKYLHSLTSVNQFMRPFSSLLKHINPKGNVMSTESYFGWELRKWVPGYDNFVASLIKDLVQFDYGAVYPGTQNYKIQNRMYFAQDHSKSELQQIFRKFISSCYNSIMQQQQKTYYVEDNTFNMLYAKEIAEIFPNSKFINVIRHPFDVISSMMQQRWAPNKLDHVCSYYKNLMFKWVRIKKNLPQDFFMEIKLESIVNNRQVTIEKMCKFFNLNMTDKMQSIDLSSSNQERYKSHFSNEQIDFMRKQLENLLDEFEYS